MHHDRILDVIEDFISPDILCYNTLFWTKEAHSKSFVSWTRIGQRIASALPSNFRE